MYFFIYVKYIKIIMVKRYCPKCNAGFYRKSNYEKHINKKYDCSPINNNKEDMLRKNKNEQNKDNIIIKENKSDNFNKSNLLRYCSIEKDFEILTIFRNFIYDVTLHSANESTRIIRPVYPKETDFDMITKSSSMMYEYITKMEQFNFEDANKIINNIINTTNNYYSNEIKQEINQDRFDTIMWTCLEMIRRISLLLHPIIPEFSENILNYLDIEKEKQSLHFFDDSLTLQKMIAEPLYLRLA